MSIHYYRDEGYRDGFSYAVNVAKSDIYKRELKKIYNISSPNLVHCPYGIIDTYEYSLLFRDGYFDGYLYIKYYHCRKKRLNKEFNQKYAFRIMMCYFIKNVQYSKLFEPNLITYIKKYIIN